MCAGSERELMVDAMWQSTTATGPNPNTEDASHEHLVMDEDTGEPVQARFTYVDEHTCIGCTYCSTVARNTFFMQEDHGRARVYDQGGDSEELLEEAIDACPVNCIHFVSLEDLVTLETERSGQRINNAARLVSQQEGTAAVPPTKARSYQSGVMRCHNCPSRGCKDCPMFGVGDNPVYLSRQRERTERRERRGEAQEEEEQLRREALVRDGVMAGDECVVDGDGVTCVAEEDDNLSLMLGALFAEPSLEDDAEPEERAGVGRSGRAVR